MGHFLLRFSLIVACFAGVLAAQTSGSLTGQVMDTTQASIQGASITAANIATGQTRRAVTDSSGRYTIADLAIGTYKVTAEQNGFQSNVVPEVNIQVAQSATVNFSLAPGTITQTIEVNGQATPLEETAGTTFNNRSIVDLPINGRDYARFSLLTPGAAASSNYIAMLTFNGGHSIHNQFQIDGVDATRVDQPYMANGFERDI